MTRPEGTEPAGRPRLGLCVSGNGYVAEAIARAAAAGLLPYAPPAILVDRESRLAALPDLPPESRPVPVFRRPGEAKPAYRERLNAAVAQMPCDRLFLTFDWLLGAGTLARFPDPPVNLHMGLLPAFRGLGALPDMLRDSPDLLGISLHEATTDTDAGPLLAQAAFRRPAGAGTEALKFRLFTEALLLSLQLLRRLPGGLAPVAPLHAPGTTLPPDPDLAGFADDFIRTRLG